MISSALEPNVSVRTNDREAKAIRALGELPPFSPILSKLLASLAKDDVSLVQLGDLIEKDAVVAGNILHIVNSAMYARRSHVNSVRYALSLLGTEKIRNLVLGMQIAGMWNHARCPKGLSMSRFNMHSAAVAMLADSLAQQLEVEYPEGAFVAGLLHDVGELLIGMGLPQEFGLVLKHHSESKKPIPECESEILGFTHSKMSGIALEAWKLPEPICRAVRMHHDNLAFAHGGEIPLGRIVDAADRYVESVGLSTFDTPEVPPDLPCIMQLGLSKERAEKLLVDFEAEFESTAQYFR